MLKPERCKYGTDKTQTKYTCLDRRRIHSHGEPVGSKSIAEKAGVSSATVRNEMAELTELGLLEQPHTSAGRVPSQKGYREFVDALMQPKTLTEAEKLTIDAMLAKSAFDPERLLRGAAKRWRLLHGTLR